MTTLADPASSNNTRTLFSLYDTVHVNGFYPYGVGPIGVTQTPRDLGYGTIAGYIAALPSAYQASATSWSGFTPTLDTECDRIAWQTASNYIYDLYHANNPTVNGSTVHFVASGQYVSDQITLNHAACWIEGSSPSPDYFGTRIQYIGAGGTLDAPTSVFRFYISDELFQPPPGRVAGIPNDPKFMMTNMVIYGTGGSLSSVDQSAGHKYVWGVRIGTSAFTHISDCNFDSSLYDGIVFTGPGLFTVIEKNQFGTIARDAIANMKGPVAPSTDNTTTFWVYNNEFIACNRYGIYLDFTGGAVQPMPIIRDNSFEHDNNTSFYYLNPQWMLGGIRSWECLIGCGNVIFDGNRFEGGQATLMWACLGIVDCDAPRITHNNMGGNLLLAQTAPSQAASDQMKTFWGIPWTITSITQANPAVVTTSATHNIANGDTVFIWNTAGTMSQVNRLVFTAANVTATTLQLQGINSTAYSAYSGSNGRIMTGNNWSDITDARNYSMGHPGDQQAEGIGGMVLDNSYECNNIVISDGTGLGVTNYNVVSNQDGGTFYSIPTIDAVTATVNNGASPAKAFGLAETQLPTLLTLVGNLRYYNCGWVSSLGSSISSTAFNVSIGASTGDYVEQRGFAAWAASTVYSALFGRFGPSFVTPLTENGFFYQVTATTGDAMSGSMEPTWPTTIGNTVVDNHVTWTCVGHALMSAQGNLLFGRMDGGLRTVNGSGPPSSGRWGVGDRIRNTAAASGGPPGWVCTTAGQPGTWKAEANLA